MTNQNVVVPEPIPAITVPAMPNSSPVFPDGSPAGGSGDISMRTKYCCSEMEMNDEIVDKCLDTMRSSSPTHSKATASAPAAVLDDAFADEVADWMMHHPSALAKFEQIMKATKGKQIVMFLDYDGTLSPIVDDPDVAFMSKSMRAAVKKVARYCPTAIVSGRCLDKVYRFVKLDELYYAGSHGMDIKGPKKSSRFIKEKRKDVLFQPATEFVPIIDELCTKLSEITKSISGSKVENNKFCASVHFRCVDEKNWSMLAEKVWSVVKGYPKLLLSSGRKVLEIRPSIEWDKGKALVYLLESLGLDNRKDIVPVYIGDDHTDEDAFQVLRDRGQGFGILVSKFPKETNASYSLQEPSEVMDFLLRLVKWKRASWKPLQRA